MIKHICNDCNHAFVAISMEEAVDEQRAARKASAKEKFEEDISYAKFCPYCGSLDIGTVQDEK